MNKTRIRKTIELVRTEAVLDEYDGNVLLSCPFCGCSGCGVIIYNATQGYYVECKACGATGPVVPHNEVCPFKKTAESWNTLTDSTKGQLLVDEERKKMMNVVSELVDSIFESSLKKLKESGDREVIKIRDNVKNEIYRSIQKGHYDE